MIINRISYLIFLSNNNNPTPVQFRSACRKCLLGKVDPNPNGNCTVESENQNPSLFNVFLNDDPLYCYPNDSYIFQELNE